MQVDLPDEIANAIRAMIHDTYAHHAGLMRSEYQLHFILDSDPNVLYKTQGGRTIHIAINAHPLLQQERLLVICKSIFTRNRLLRDLLHRGIKAGAVVTQADAIKWYGVDVTEGHSSVDADAKINAKNFEAELTIYTKIVAKDKETGTKVEATFQGSAFAATPLILQMLREKVGAREFSASHSIQEDERNVPLEDLFDDPELLSLDDD